MKYRRLPTSRDMQNVLAKTIFQRAVTVSESVSKKYQKVIQSSFGLYLICLGNRANYIQKVAISGTNPTPSATIRQKAVTIFHYPNTNHLTDFLIQPMAQLGLNLNSQISSPNPKHKGQCAPVMQHDARQTILNGRCRGKLLLI